MAIGIRPDVTDYVAWETSSKAGQGRQLSPTSLADLLSQCTAANVGMMMPDYVNDLFVLQRPKNVFVLQLPPGDLVKGPNRPSSAGGPIRFPSSTMTGIMRCSPSRRPKCWTFTPSGRETTSSDFANDRRPTGHQMPWLVPSTGAPALANRHASAPSRPCAG